MKITGGFLKNRSLSTLKGNTTRPTSERLRQAVFNILQEEVRETQFLDLFAGSGAMGIEALSRGATHATFIENHSAALRNLRDNLTQLNLITRSTIFSVDALIALQKLIKKKAAFDLIYIDPPYKERILQQKVLTLIDASNLLKPEGTLLIEVASKTSLSSFKTLKIKNVRQVGSSHLFQYKN